MSWLECGRSGVVMKLGVNIGCGKCWELGKVKGIFLLRMSTVLHKY